MISFYTLMIFTASGSKLNDIIFITTNENNSIVYFDFKLKFANFQRSEILCNFPKAS